MQFEYDEVLVNSNEVLEGNVAAIRADVTELKNNFGAAVTRIDGGIKAAVSKLEAESRAMTAKSESDLEKFAARVEKQFSEMRQGLREMRVQDEVRHDQADKNHDLLSAKIDKGNEKLSERIGGSNERLAAKLDVTNDRIDATRERFSKLHEHLAIIGGKLTTLQWTLGGSAYVITIAFVIGKAFHWF